MKIAFVTLYDVGSYGGTTRVLCDLANGLTSRGHEVEVFYFETKKKDIPYYLRSDIKCLNCCKTLADCFLGNEFLAKMRGIFALGRSNRRIARNDFEAKYKGLAISRMLQNFDADVVISFSQLTTYMLLSKIIIGAPVITMLHNKPESYFKRPEFELFKKSLEQSAAIQVLMPEFVPVVRDYINARKISYIPNIAPQYDEEADLRNPCIINVARVMTVKRQHLLVEAFAIISKKYPEWEVEIWGGANEKYKTELERLIKQYNLQKRVFLKGISSQIKEKLYNSSIFVLPSMKEGFPLALCEAMSMGLPAVGCKSCSGVNSIIKDGENGFLCDDCAESIAEALEKLIDNYSLRKTIGLRAKADMRSFSCDSVIDKWDVLLKEVCE